MRKVISLLLTTMMCLSMFSIGFAEDAKADEVYINGNIYTVQEKYFNVEAMAVKDGKFIFVGDNKGANNFVGPNTKVFDLKGQTVIPGIVEGHLHFSGMGSALLQLDAFWKPKEEILQAVKEQASRLNPGEWITGRGWNQEVWPGGEFPTKEELDAVSPNNPVILTRTCGHAFWVNSAALELANITEETKDPVGGEIIKNSDGSVRGVLTDTAGYAVRELISPLSKERVKESLGLAQEVLFSYGITSAMDAGIGVETINTMKEMYKSGDLDVRLYSLVSSGEDAKKYYKTGPEVGLYDGRFTVRGVKFFSDGSLGARSAWMLEDYSDRPNHVGNGRYTDQELYTAFKEASDNGFQSSIHAIGDAANRQAIDAYEKVINNSNNEDHRFRIEHFQIVDLDDIQKSADLGMIASMQFVHATSDKNMAEDRVGSERIQGAYAWRKVLDAGGIIANGSDAPVENVNPYHGLYAGVTRSGTNDGLPKGGWYPGEALTRYEALRAFTLDSAYAAFEEDVKGSIEAGKYADFVIIDKDYMTCAPEEIKDINALTTVLGGKVVYTKPNTNPLG